MKRIKNKLLNLRMLRRLLSYVIAGYIRLVLLTSRKVYLIPEASKVFFSGEKQVLVAFWHGRLLLMPHLRPKGRGLHVLISAHRDGLLISETIRRFGVGTVVGSTTKGSLSALKRIFHLVKQGHDIAITPDGPKGPFQVAASGIAHIAARSGLPVLAVTFSATRCRHMQSWDRFLVALPFSTIYFAASLPIASEGNTGKEEIESLRARIESSLSLLTEDTDRRAGVV